MNGLLVRPPSPDDVPALAELFNEVSSHAGAGTDTDEAELRTWLSSPLLDVQLDVRVAVAPDGRIVGYGDVTDDARDGTKLWIDVREHPDAGDGSVARTLLPVLEARARTFAARAPAEITPALRGGAWSGEENVLGVLREAGYRLVRHSFHMEADLGGDLPEPAWPEGISLRTFRPGDEEAVLATENEGFADMWEFVPSPDDEWRHHLVDVPDFDPELWFLAYDGDELVAIALCRPAKPGEPDLGWVRVLAVRPPWRRRGIALALLRHAFRELARRGRPRVGLGVDGESTTGALELYAQAGMRVASRYDILEKSFGGT